MRFLIPILTTIFIAMSAYANSQGRFLSAMGDYGVCSDQAKISIFKESADANIKYTIFYGNTTAGSRTGFKESGWQIFDDGQSLWIWDGATLSNITFSEDAIDIKTSVRNPELLKAAPKQLMQKITKS